MKRGRFWKDWRDTVIRFDVGGLKIISIALEMTTFGTETESRHVWQRMDPNCNEGEIENQFESAFMYWSIKPIS